MHAKLRALRGERASEVAALHANDLRGLNETKRKKVEK